MQQGMTPQYANDLRTMNNITNYKEHDATIATQ